MQISKRTLANRENARRSTGPVTIQGKWRSSQNARTHGLTSKIIPDSLKPDGVAPTNEAGEPESEYQILLDLYVADLQPETQREFDLVRSLASFQWQLRRADAFMDRASKNLHLYDSLYVSKTMDNFTRQQARVQRSYNQTLATFHEEKNERIDAQQAKLDHATTFLKFLEDHNHPAAKDWDPKKNGFDFSFDEVKDNLTRWELENLAGKPVHLRESTITYKGIPLIPRSRRRK